MKDNFEIKGEWFLPSDKEDRLKGILKFDNKQGATLETFDSFKKNSINIEIILGDSDDGKQITLYKVYLQKGWSNFTINYILIGHHFEDIKNIRFDEIVSEISNLDEWVCISGFPRPKTPKSKKPKWDITLNYKQPEPIDFLISDALSGRFNFTPIVPAWSTTHMKEVNLAQRTQFILKSDKEMSFDDCLKNLFTFSDFITLATYQAAYPNKIILKSTDITEHFIDAKPRKKKITLHFVINGRNDSLDMKTWIEMLYSYPAIKDDFSGIISKWYECRDLLESTHNLLFEQFYNDGRFTENSFLNMAQALESFHARLNNGTKMPSQKYKAIRDEIIGLVPNEYHTLLNSLFKFGNHLDLHTRIDEVIKKYSNDLINSAIGDKEEFIKKVKHSRNYYTHYSSDLRKKALKGVPLFWLSQKIKMLIVAAYLKEVGFDSDYIFNTMKRNKRYFVSPFMI